MKLITFVTNTNMNLKICKILIVLFWIERLLKLITIYAIIILKESLINDRKLFFFAWKLILNIPNSKEDNLALFKINLLSLNECKLKYFYRL